MTNTTSDKSLIADIKSKGYWTISFSPLEFHPNAIPTLPKCKSLLSSSAVRLRGWPYPATRNHDSIEPVSVDDYVEAQTDWEDCKEIARLYQSGKFVHLLALREDRCPIEGLKNSYWIPEGEKKILGTVATVYLFTEIFEFLVALNQKGLYKDGVDIEIGLHNNADRVLVTDHNRGPLFQAYRCHSADIVLSKRLSGNQINTESRTIATDLLVALFHKFNWDNPPRGVFKEDQRKLLARQI